MGKIEVEPWDTNTYGELNEDNIRKKLTSQGYNCQMYTFTPGTEFPDHTHSVEKKDSVVSGEFQISMYGEAVILKPGDMVVVPKDTVHNAKAVGKELVVFCAAEKSDDMC